MMVDGFLVVDKPAGRSSHDVVAAVRRVVGMKKAGHAGTLDPMATGVLVVGLGRCTRLIRFIQDQDKVYEAVARFGVATDSLDADGTETGRNPLPVNRVDLEAIVPQFLGTILQVPPMVSALKHRGKRLYDLAREGVEVEREARPVEIHELTITSLEQGDYPLVGLRVRCGTGTYVRSLADDMAAALGGRAHLTALRRTTTGTLNLDDAVAWDRLDDWERHLIAPARGLRHMPSVATDDSAAVRSGRSISAPHELAPGENFLVVDADDKLLAVYGVVDDLARPQVVLS